MSSTAIELATLLWQEYKFKLMALETPAKGFEEIFCHVMRLAEPDHFHVSREGGPTGDRSCDGWNSAEKTLYAVYAPLTKKRKDAIRAKLKRDLQGALKHYPEMRNWRLVHNDLFGSHADITRVLEELRTDSQFERVAILSDFGPRELWSKLEALSIDQRSSFLRGPHWHVLDRADDWTNIGVRFHDNVPDACVRPALRSLVQLCNNFEADSTLDLVSTTMIFGAVVVWWLNDEALFGEYRAMLGERSNVAPYEMQITALAALLRCIEICARRLGVGVHTLIESQLASKSIDPGLRVALQIARDQLRDPNAGIRVDNPKTRQKFVEACLHAVTSLIGMASFAGIPAIFTLQDLIISMQRIDYADGRYICRDSEAPQLMGNQHVPA